MSRAVIDAIRVEEEIGADYLSQLKCGEVAAKINSRLGWVMEGGAYRGPEIVPEAWSNSDPSLNTEYGHCWNVRPDGAIVDATADQFGDIDPVRIIPVGDERWQWYIPECGEAASRGYPPLAMKAWGPGYWIYDHYEARKETPD